MRFGTTEICEKWAVPMVAAICYVWGVLYEKKSRIKTHMHN